MGYDARGKSPPAGPNRALSPNQPPRTSLKGSPPPFGATFRATPKIEFPKNRKTPHFPVFFAGFSILPPHFKSPT
jgi:hypothetical protein